jgi:hypothetical protein
VRYSVLANTAVVVIFRAFAEMEELKKATDLISRF